MQIKDPVLQLVSLCLSSAVSNGNFDKDNGSIDISCNEDVAEEFYNKLGELGYSDVPVTIPKQGKFLRRFFDGQNRCTRELEDASGRTGTHFSCHLFIRAPTLLNK